MTHTDVKELYLQSLYYEIEKTVLVWDILWHKNIVCMNCEIYLALEYAHKPAWPDPQALRNLKYINPILRNWNFQEARLEHF